MRILALTAALSVGVATPAVADPRLGFDGLGPVALGMTVGQAMDTGAMAHDLAICPGEDVDFKPEYRARALWGTGSQLIAIQAQRSIRGIVVGSRAKKVRKKFPDGRFRGREIFEYGRVYAVERNGTSLQFVLRDRTVRRITLTGGFVSRGGEWTC
jgi:hypothetical protein